MTQTSGDLQPRNPAVGEDFFSPEEVVARIEGVAAEMRERYKDENPLFLILLNGGGKFGTDVISAMVRQDLSIDPDVHYMRTTTYEDSDKAKKPKILHDLYPLTSAQDRLVVVIDDICDSGDTSAFVLNNMLTRGAAETELVVLLERDTELLRNKEGRPKPVISGFKLDSEIFFVGMGMDLAQKGRWHPGIAAAVRSEVAVREVPET